MLQVVSQCPGERRRRSEVGGAAAPGMEEESHLRHFPEVEFAKLAESQGVLGEGERCLK